LPQFNHERKRTVAAVQVIAGLASGNRNGGVAVVALSATRNLGCHTMSKRPPYIEIIVTVAVMAFLTLIVVGGVNTRQESFGQVTMRAE
jgi:hypothetical protein